VINKAKQKRRWSFEEDRRLMELAGSSKSLKAIAEQLGRSPDSVAKMARRLGLSLKSGRTGSKSASTRRP